MEHRRITRPFPSDTIFCCYTLKVILANMASMRRTLGEVEGCKRELQLCRGAEENLLIFSTAPQLLLRLEELEELAEQQSPQLKVRLPFSHSKEAVEHDANS